MLLMVGFGVVVVELWWRLGFFFFFSDGGSCNCKFFYNLATISSYI